MNARYYAVLFLIFISGSLVFAQLKQLQAVKKESYITYKLTHPLHEIEATSKDVYCIINLDPVKKEIKNVSVQIDVTTFDSGNSNRDSHAMETVDAISYPDVRFISSSIYQEGDSLKIHGRLTFHGITKDIYIAAVSKWTDSKLIVNGNFDISLTVFKVPRPSLLLIPVEDTLRFSLQQIFNL
ncbi:MAG: YceI family protein [Ignavibacteriaceae bacterium]|jgi:polyisoprenoid-binding protein YceI